MSQKRAILIPDTYSLNKELNVYFPESGENKFNYSDGDAVENKILEIILSANDLSVGSSELRKQIYDWPTRYHFSPQRVDLMRPLKHLLKGDILEIGSGCGAITRYLAETGDSITAVEGSAKRARITAARCRDLNNVFVYCDNFNDFKSDKKFDVVTLIGVLEYANMFIDGESAPQRMLEKIQTFLKPNGLVIIAIENQLGLKYFAGAPEDHLNIPFASIENRYKQNGPVTFGKKTLEKQLKETGFGQVDFLYPFPDYKLPQVIVTEEGCATEDMNLSDLLRYKIRYIQQTPYSSSFNESKTIPQIVENKLAGDLANSFLIVASLDTKKRMDPTQLAYTFSSLRKKEYCKMNSFVRKDKTVWVMRERTYPFVKPDSSLLTQELTDEKYIDGELLSDGLASIVGEPEWTIEQIADWARVWVNYLKAGSTKRNADKIALLDGKYFDATPFNIIVAEKNRKTIREFDLEWKVNQELRIDYIVFRALYYSLLEITHFHTPATYTSYSEICSKVMALLLPEISVNIGLYKKLEKEILTAIIGDLGTECFEDCIERETTHQLNHTTTNTSPFTPVHEMMIQVFWGDDENTLSEEKSSVKHIFLTELATSISFDIIPGPDKVNIIRLDLGATPGLANIHKITIKNQKEHEQWTWDMLSLDRKENVLLIQCHEEKNTLLHISTSNDPKLIFELNKILPDLNAPFTVELSLSSVGPYQLNQLSEVTPLAFIAQRDFDKVIQEIQILENDRKNLLHQISLHVETINNTNKQQLLYEELLKSSEQRIKQLTEDKSSLNEDKAFLNKELTFKNDLNEKLNQEKEKWIKECEEKENELAETASLITDMEEERNQLQQQLNNVLEESKAERKVFDQKIGLSELRSHELQQDKNLLMNENAEKTVFIKDLYGKNEFLQRENQLLQTTITTKAMEFQTLEHQLKDTSAKLSFIEESLKNQMAVTDRVQAQNDKLHLELNEKVNNLQTLNGRLKELEEMYENKNGFQILWNRLFSPKVK